MGCHRHVRVCDNGLKQHSTGGFNDYIYEGLIKVRNHQKACGHYFGDCAALNGKGFSTLIFIKRHCDHNIRTIEKIVTITDKNEYKEITLNVVLNVSDVDQRTIYRQLSRLNLFYIAAFINSLTLYDMHIFCKLFGNYLYE